MEDFKELLEHDKKDQQNIKYLKSNQTQILMASGF